MSEQQTSLLKLADLDLDKPASMAQIFVQSGYFRDVRGGAQALVKIQAGKELGLPPFTAMQGIDIVEGKCRLTSNALAMMVKRHPDYDYRVREWGDEQCTIEFFLVSGKKRESIGFGEFTLAEARQAGVVKERSNWVKWPRAMLFARAMSAGVRAHCPDVTFGIAAYTEGDFEKVSETQPRFVDAEVVDIDRPGGKGSVDLDDLEPGKTNGGGRPSEALKEEPGVVEVDTNRGPMPPQEEEEAPPVELDPSEQVIVSPAAMKLAKDNGIDLYSITGTGRGGSIVIGDVRVAVKAKKDATPPDTELPAGQTESPADEGAASQAPPSEVGAPAGDADLAELGNLFGG